MDVYRGADKVAELDDYSQLRVGANKPAFIYEGAELVYPVPVRDGLVLWYDFSGRTNADAERGVAQDLSGNGNHGTLNNFAYADDSGYQDGGLKFDGVDDYVIDDKKYSDVYALEATFVYTSYNDYRGIISSLNHFANGGHGFAITTYYYNRLRINVHTGLELTVNQYNVKDLKEGEKYHVIAMIDESNKESIKLRLYINGILEMENILPSFSPSGNRNSQGVMVGKYSSAHDGYYYNKPIYSARFYNRLLTPEEIQHNYEIEKERFNL